MRNETQEDKSQLERETTYGARRFPLYPPRDNNNKIAMLDITMMQPRRWETMMVCCKLSQDPVGTDGTGGEDYTLHREGIWQEGVRNGKEIENTTLHIEMQAMQNFLLQPNKLNLTL